MPERRLTRRAVVATAALVPGAAVLAGCKDDPSAGSGPSGTKGAVNGTTTSPDPATETPTADPAVVAALSAAATQVTQLSQLYATASRKFPALRAQLAAGAKYHATHLAKLKETQGVTAQATKAAVLASSQAAIATIAKQERAAATAHVAAAAKLSGAPARLLAEIAASETQLGATLTPAKNKKEAAS
ncbi:cell division protein FtsK [Kribbella sp. NPDC004536]|uniref:cell division protein FtsK n=1 Tax=Kribbella sp. NPDC004536 TaxID=3364106 RepID=UPI0036836FFA